MTDGAPAQPDSPPSINPQRSLDKSLIRGIGWTGGMRWFVQVVSWTATLVIARLLTPAQYGLVGMAVVYSGFVEMFSDFGLGAAIVQRRALDDEQVARIGGFAALLGLALFGVSLLLAKPIAAFYGEPAVAGIIVVLAINYVLGGIQLLPLSLLVRELRFRQLAWLRGAEAFSLTAWTITLAALGAGYWALVFGLVASKLTATVLALIWRRHRIAWPFPLKPIASEITFGSQFMISNMAWYLYTTADVAVVGRVLGKVVLGAYSIAWNLASVPVERIAAPLGDVFRGVFSAVQTDRRALARYLCALTEGLAIVTFPLSVGLALVASDCIPVLLGTHWLAAIQPLRWIALYALVRSVSTLYAPILVATGHTRLNMQIHLVGAIVMPVLFVAGTHWGMAGVAAAGLVGYTCVVVSLSLKQVLGIVGISFGRYLQSLVPAVIGTLVMAGVVLPLQRFGPAVPGSLAHLLIEVLAGGVVYAATIALIRGQRLLAMVQLLRDARKGSPAAASSRLLLEEQETTVRTASRRLLVITYHFPPDGAVGGLRWAALARYLKPLGWEVAIVTAAASQPDHGPHAPTVVSSPRARTLLDLYRHFVLRRDVDRVVSSEPAPERGLLRSELTAALSLPDESRGWALRAAWRARAIVRSFRPDVVVSSGPPHSAHLVARLATAGTRVRWVADLRDPWPQMLADVKKWDPVQGSGLARLVMPLVERAIMPAADGIVANTQVLAAQLADRYPKTPVAWVRNGFDPERCPPRSRARGSAFIIRHVGSLYGGRSFKITLEALRQFIDRKSLTPNAVRLEIAGQVDEPYGSRLRANISRLELHDYVAIVGPLSGAEALQRIRDSDLSLVLAQGQDLQVPAKLYESLGMGVWTLALADADSATAREATLLGALVAQPDDIAAVGDAFDQVYQEKIGALTPRQPAPEILYPVIAERVHRILESSAGFSEESVNFAGPRPGPPVRDLAASVPRSETE